MQLRSVLALPVIKRTKLIGVLYLENRLSDGVFTPEKTQMTELLTSQAAISLQNARLVEEMKQVEEELRRSKEELELRVQERTRDLARTNRQLEKDIARRKRAEEMVKAEQKRLNDILELLPAYLVLLTPDYRVPFVNRFSVSVLVKPMASGVMNTCSGGTSPVRFAEPLEPWKKTNPRGGNGPGRMGAITTFLIFPLPMWTAPSLYWNWAWI